MASRTNHARNAVSGVLFEGELARLRPLSVRPIGPPARPFRYETEVVEFMKIQFNKPEPANVGTMVVAALDDRKLTPAASSLDKRTGGVITRAMGSSRFRGRKDESLEILAPKGLPVGRVLLVGLGKANEVDAVRLEALGGNLVAQLN